MAILSNLNSKNAVALLDGGGSITPTYGSYLSGGTPSPSVPTLQAWSDSPQSLCLLLETTFRCRI